MADGSMSKAVSGDVRDRNRRQFLLANNITPEQTALVWVTYDGEEYCRYNTVGEEAAGKGIVYGDARPADAVFTKERGVALFLPVADCVAAVIHDPVQHVLGVSHLGRHNLLQSGGRATIDYMVRHFGSTPSDIRVWLGPAAGKTAYPLNDFDGDGLHEQTIQQLVEAGMTPQSIEVDHRDTTTDADLFSHSEFLHGRQSIDGRQAVVAMMRP